MNVSNMPDGQKRARIDWTDDRKREFVDLWNRVDPHKVADHFGMPRATAFAMASRFRSEGMDVHYRPMGTRHVPLYDADRAKLTDMLARLCVRFGTTPEDVLGNGRKHDGRHAAKRALIWAGHELLGLSWKQVGLFFGGANHTTMIWCAKHVSEAGKIAARAAYDCVTETAEAA